MGEVAAAATWATHVCYLTGVHPPLENAGTQHPVGDLIAHQTLAHCAVDNPHFCLLQDGGGVTWRTQ